MKTWAGCNPVKLPANLFQAAGIIIGLIEKGDDKMNATLENMQKAQQGAAMLVSDLRECLKTCSALEAMLILPEIEKSADKANKLSAMLSAMNAGSENKPF